MSITITEVEDLTTGRKLPILQNDAERELWREAALTHDPVDENGMVLMADAAAAACAEWADMLVFEYRKRNQT